MRTLIHRTSRRLPLALMLLAAAGALPALSAKEDASAVPGRPNDRTIIHVLNRLGFGPRPGDVERVRAAGLQAYIDRQLQPDRIDDAAMAGRLASLQTLTKSSREIAEQYLVPAQMLRRQQRKQDGAGAPARSSPVDPAEARGTADDRMEGPKMPADPIRRKGAVMFRCGRGRARTRGKPRAPDARCMTDLVDQKVLRAAYSERQLEEVMVDFWFNHFNVFAGKGATRGYLTEYERDAIRPHVLGRFRDLLQATAESPAMLFFLDNWQSSTPDAAALPDRRSMQSLRSPDAGRRGVRRAPPARAQATPRPGQTAAQPRRPRGINENYARELMELHTLGVDGGYTQKDVQDVARAFTGWTIRNPRSGGEFTFEPRMHDNGEKIVLGQRVTAGGKRDGEQVLDILAKHPSTATFIATKLSRRFVSDSPPAPLIDRAARRFRETGGDIRETVRTIVTSPEFFSAEAHRAKVKTPFEFVVSAVRATGTEATTGLPFAATLRDLGTPLYMCQPPTGYADRADAWVNTGALLGRMNFAVSLTTGRFGPGGPDGRGAPAAPAAAREAFVSGVLGGDLSEPTRATVAKAEQSAQGLALLLGSPEFQRR